MYSTKQELGGEKNKVYTQPRKEYEHHGRVKGKGKGKGVAKTIMKMVSLCAIDMIIIEARIKE